MLPMLNDAWIAMGRRLLASGPPTRDRGKQQVIAFTTKRNRVAAHGRNSYTKTHPEQARYARLAGSPKKEFLHAEVAALLRSPDDVDTLFVMRFNKQGDPVCAKPCPLCTIAIRLFNPNLRVIHT
jgi:hypothetical protein